MNQVFFVGNLVRDPQIRATKTGKPAAQFSVACNRNIVKDGEKKQLTDYINVVAWGNLAEAVGNQLKKGTYVFVTGRYSTRSYETPDGQKRYVTEVVASMVAIPLDTRSGSSEGFGKFGKAEHDDRGFKVFGAPRTDEDMIPF